MLTPELASFLQSATNIALLAGGIKILRAHARMEMRVEMMWRVFAKKFEIEDEPSGPIHLGN